MGNGEAWVRNRWLHVFFTGTMLLTGVITVSGWSPWPTRWPALVVIAVLVVAYAAFGHRGYDDPRAAAVFLPLVVLAAVLLPSVVPSTAFVQCILFPLVWVQTESIRTGVLLSLGVGLASAVGLQVASGPDALVSTLLIEGVSVVGACAMGTWISSVARLSDERRRLVDELRATQASLADAHRSAGVTSERERIAREIHDTVAQNLAGIVMLTERARGDLAARRTGQLDERLTVLRDSAREALEETRTLVAAGTAGARGTSLTGALHRLAERFARETGVPAAVSADPSAAEALDRDDQVVLLRVAQESLANVRAHAAASDVRIVLHVDDVTARISVEDDGRGFDVTRPGPGLGLRGLQQRLSLAGGTCTVTSVAGRGTTVLAVLPATPASRTTTPTSDLVPR